MMLLNKYKNFHYLYTYFKKNFRPVLGNNFKAYSKAKFYLSAGLYNESDDDTHLKATMLWLARAQDQCNGKGVAASYDLGKGWQVAYPETSGYIIATFLEYATIYKDQAFYKRAIEIGDWEIEIQTNGGGILSNPTKSHVRVFNTGQVILGWCLLYEKTNDKKYLDAACKAGDFLCRTQENDGRWVDNTHCGARTYHARIDWALLRLYELTGKKEYLETAEKNIIWVLAQQNKNGWFENCGFDNDMPVMHVIVYTIRGLLECHAMNIPEINKLDILPKLIKITNCINEFINDKPYRSIKGFIPTSFQNNWVTDAKHSCLTGNAQHAIFLYRLSQVTNDQTYAAYADVVVSALKKTQLISTQANEQNIAGAIAGSYPIYVGYCPHSFPNWATKFFADALLMKNNYKNNLQIKA
jgi:hypothetical protein